MPICETPDCGKESKLRCPTCVKMGIDGSFFCSQECFKGYWKQHKGIHKLLENHTANGHSSVHEDQVIWPGFSFAGSLRPYKQSPRREVPDHIQRPDYATDKEGVPWSERRDKNNLKVLDDEDIEGVRVASKLAREILEVGMEAAQAGVTTDEIDRLIHEATIDRECYPSPLNYYGFPKSCCTSLNEVICHGIPDLRPLQDGDILNIDVTAFHRGFHGDLNETLFVGAPDEASKELVTVTWECLQKAIEFVRPGNKYRDIGEVIQKHASAHNLSVVRTYCGHGIHRLFHCVPNVPHYAKNKAIGIMKPGHVFTIEPMINQGQWKDVLWPDNWTATTVDGKRSAQFEETLLVTETGCEILTKRTVSDGKPFFKQQLGL